MKWHLIRARASRGRLRASAGMPKIINCRNKRRDEEKGRERVRTNNPNGRRSKVEIEVKIRELSATMSADLPISMAPFSFDEAPMERKLIRLCNSDTQRGTIRTRVGD